MEKTKILILGKHGMLGQQLVKLFGDRVIAWDRNDLDVTNAEALALKLSAVGYKLSAVINCVAYNDVDGAEDNQDLAFKLNTELPENLAKICKGLNIILVHFSTNYIFDGEKGGYNEADLPNPVSIYAKSKYQAELKVASIANKFFIIRTAALFGQKGESKSAKKSFVDLMINLGKSGNKVQVINDEIGSMTYVVDLADQIKLLLEQAKPFGVYHIVNSGQGSWYDFAKEIFKLSKINAQLEPVKSEAFSRKALRPKKSVLINTKLQGLRPWQEALNEFLISNS